MANPEHVEILKQGVDVWNKWRKKSPEAYIDFTVSYNILKNAYTGKERNN
jgi:hypothetical protein